MLKQQAAASQDGVRIPLGFGDLRTKHTLMHIPGISKLLEVLLQRMRLRRAVR